MPWTCFSYPADVPPGANNRNIAQSTSSACAKWGYLGCFSYGADVLVGPETGGMAQSAPAGPRRMAGGSCFSY